MAVVTIAEPRPVVTLTEMPPMRLHTEMYHIMFLSPYLRALSLARGAWCTRKRTSGPNRT
jgi:hypothetical protein